MSHGEEIAMHDLDRAMGEPADGRFDHAEQQEFLEVLGELLGSRPGHVGMTSQPAGRWFSRAVGETELAAELLEAHETGELDRFLGRLVGRAAGGRHDFVRSDTGRALTGILRQASRALPATGMSAGAVFGLELEGLSQEDSEFETAKAFVRFANAAVARAVEAPLDARPMTVAKAAVSSAAHRHAPGLAALAAGGARAGGSGRG
ncbi:hypothetical protein [Alloactinosynnema sp. L-07]|nr:hypothetical protein [Alloactinosynnema sp. L-07]